MLLTIEKLIYGGDGLSRLPPDASGRGKAVFIPFVLAEEQVEASITEQKSSFARARVQSVTQASPHRVDPPCPYFGRCGGCHYQHADYEHQLQAKKQILRETLLRTAKLELANDIHVHPSPPWNYRNRSRLQVQTKPTFLTGYFRMGSHELLSIEQCPISSPLINRGIAVLWPSGRAEKVPQGVREVEFFANADDSQLLIEISCSSDARRAAVRMWAEELSAGMPEVTGIAAFRQSQSSAARLQEQLVSVGVDHLTYRTQRASYQVSSGSFFQTNRHLTDELVKTVTEGQSGELALDLFAGVGLFSTVLAGAFHRIVSVEMSQTCSADLSCNQTSNGEAVQATAEQYLARAENSGRGGKGVVLPHDFHKPDLAVVDPPRTGLGERVARLLTSLGAPRVVYVSCDPATLSRDLVALVSGGYRIEQVHLLDLFPQTYHFESVVHLALQ